MQRSNYNNKGDNENAINLFALGVEIKIIAKGLKEDKVRELFEMNKKGKL